MAVLTRNADEEELVIKIDDVFDTFFTKNEIIDLFANIFVKKSGDTMTGALYVPDNAGNTTTDIFLKKSGDTMIGILYVFTPALPYSLGNETTTPQDINEITDIFVKKSGDTMTGVLKVLTPALPS
jgi:hypothetical protein